MIDRIGLGQKKINGFGVLLVSAAVVLLLVPLQSCRSAPAEPSREVAAAATAAVPEPLRADGKIIAEHGIRVLALRTTAAGNMLDLRFRVLDREKAMPFFLKELKPYLIDQETGAVLEVPVPAKGGPMRPTSRDPREGITYFMLFGNPGKMIQPGREVILAVGDHRIEGLVVE